MLNYIRMTFICKINSLLAFLKLDRVLLGRVDVLFPLCKNMANDSWDGVMI